MSIRVVICDDQDLVRDGLQAILSTAPGIDVVGEATDGSEVVAVVGSTGPDVVLMDLKMPGVNGVQATRAVKDAYPDVKVLVLTTYEQTEWVMDAIKSGASGYMLKDTPRNRLIEAIEGTAAGKTHIDPGVAGDLFDQLSRGEPAAPTTAMFDDLSERELDVLKLLGRGLANSAIAEQLYLSEGTVRNYVSSILAKLDVTDRTQAAVLAVRHGMVQ